MGGTMFTSDFGTPMFFLWATLQSSLKYSLMFENSLDSPLKKLGIRFRFDSVGNEGLGEEGGVQCSLAISVPLCFFYEQRCSHH